MGKALAISMVINCVLISAFYVVYGAQQRTQVAFDRLHASSTAEIALLEMQIKEGEMECKTQ